MFIVKFLIKDIRKELGITLKELEAETGIDRNRLGDIENNRVKSNKEILFVEMMLIAKALTKTIDDLYIEINIEFTR